METSRTKADLLKALVAVDRNRPLLERAEQVVFREDGPRPLHAYVFRPAGWSAGDLRPAIAFFHGSLWEKGLVSQFAPQALSFAERGLVAILFEYRMHGPDGAQATDALDDVHMAHRWTAASAARLGIDPGKVILGGASAGAWMAMVRTLQLLARKPEEREQPPPAALVLFEPICEVAGKTHWSARFPDQRAAKRLTPRKLLARGAPPAIFFHGSLDPVVPFEPSAKLAKAWRGKSTRSDFIPYEGAGHGFYNFNVDVRLYENTLNAADDFLVSLGLLQPGEPTVAI